MEYLLTNIHRIDSKGEGKGILGVSSDNLITYNSKKTKKPVSFNVGGDYYAYPGFINSHDHLLGNYFPRVGNGPYLNWLPWDNDLKSAKIYQERAKLTNYEIYFIACLRNLISGVTWISDHIPHVVNEKFIPHLPINIISRYTLAHEVSSYDLKWGDPKKEHEIAKKEKIPFITHIEEGFDEEAKKGVDYLKEYQALDEYTVMVHGIALSEEDLKDIGIAKAHLVWCPTSNTFMFSKTADVKNWLKNKINVCLGTDSPMSGGLNLLEEIRFARSVYEKMYGEKLDERLIFQMITSNPAKAFKIPAGDLSENSPANFVITRKITDNPYTNLAYLTLSDIALVVVNGKPLYGDMKFAPLLKELKIQHWKIEVENEEKFLAIRGSLKILKKLKTLLGYPKYLPFLPINLD
ncbi:MAG TPA: hydrolase [Spirochaetia bacterium]|nr:MAG: hypothetical protein A2Y41_00230 [Spirochaetes bacterium GWB1_36_13]HCL57420.1 hydrolase [Spirochaetia bacterium]